MRTTGLGRVLFGLSFAVLGALSIVFHDFALMWEPLPGAIARNNTLAILSAAILIACGIALLRPRTAVWSAPVLTVYLGFRVLRQLPGLAAHPLTEANWYSVSENLLLMAGAWTILALLPRKPELAAKFVSARVGQIFFAIALPAIGLSHFFYLGQTAPLIPSWIPFHVTLAYLTGAAHIAAGIGIFFSIMPRLAATLEALMASIFTLLVWVPMVSAASATRFDWSEICVSTAIAGSAWAVAETLRGRPWGIVHRA